MPDDTFDLSGTRFGGYDLVEQIGRGGMGVVYRAVQRSLDRDVAVKVLSPHLAANRKFTQRFVREARAAGRLSHPNVVQGIDVGEVEGRYFFAMELVEGETLLERLRRAGPIDEALAHRVLVKIADALAHAARHGITHRDIKPDNILMSTDGEPKLADLGLAKVARRVHEDDDPDRPESDVASSITSHGSKTVVLGTAAYIAPEQAMAKTDIDVRADLYALGMSMYHLLTGALPFPADNRTEMLAHHLETPMPDVRGRAPKVSTGMAALLMRLGEKKPDDRPQSPEEVLDALAAVGAGAPMPWETVEGIARRKRIIARRRRTRVASQGGVAVAAIALVAIVAALAFSGDGATRKRRVRKTPRDGRSKPVRVAKNGTRKKPVRRPVEPPPPPLDRSALIAADAWYQAHADDLDGAIDRYWKAADRSRGEVRQQAEGKARRLERKRKRQLAEKTKTLRRDIRALIGTAQFKAAAERLATAPRAWRESADGKALQEELADAVDDAFGAVRQQVNEAQESKDYVAAAAALRPVLEWGVPHIVQRAKSLLRNFEQMQAQWDAMKRGSIELGIARHATKVVRALLARRNVGGARTKVDDVASRVDTQRAREVLDEERASVADAAALVSALSSSSRLLKGQAIKVGARTGTVVRITDGVVVLKLRSGQLKRPVHDLSTATFLDLARRALDAGARPADGVTGEPAAGWIVLALAAGETDAASTALEAGEWEFDVQFRLQNLLEMGDRLDDELAAFDLLTKAEAAATAGNADRAQELLDEAESDYSATQALQTAQVRRRDIRLSIERSRQGDDQPRRGDGDDEPGHELPGGG